jgi:hypothetical protein
MNGVSRIQPICATYPVPWKSTNAVKASNFGSVAARVTSQTPDPANHGQMMTVTIAKVFGGLQDKSEDAKELAAFIVEAVNSHATLKARNEFLEAQVQGLLESLGSLAEVAKTVPTLKARVAELEGALETAESEARRYAEMYRQSSDGRNTFIILADRIAALSHAGPVARDGGK